MAKPTSKTGFAGGLLARSFLLIAALLTLSMGAWLAMLHAFEEEPEARQLAQEIGVIVNLTRAALVNARPEKRIELLGSLSVQEGITVLALESEDQVVAMPASRYSDALLDELKKLLGPKTQVADKVNHQPGLWVSFLIDGDSYWLVLARYRVPKHTPTEWAVWVAIALLLSFGGAVIVSLQIDRPLRALADAAKSLAQGDQPDDLPERGPAEIMVVNHSFNWMARTLRQQEEERALILAGISHDLRTPITRLQLEIELAPQLEVSTREAMLQDLEQMNRIVGKFLDYARAGSEPQTLHVIDVVPMLADIVQRLQLRGAKTLVELPEEAFAACDHNDLWRALDNLAENALRYGRTPGSEQVTVDLRCDARPDGVLIVFADHGPGVERDVLPAIAQPFVRGDTARSFDGGCGLGLAIVNRLVERHGGHMRFGPTFAEPPHGLEIEIYLPATPRRGQKLERGLIADTLIQ